MHATTLCRSQTCILVQTLPKLLISGLKQTCIVSDFLSIMDKMDEKMNECKQKARSVDMTTTIAQMIIAWAG